MWGREPPGGGSQPDVRPRTDARRCGTSCREHARTRRPVKAESPRREGRPEGNVAPKGRMPVREKPGRTVVRRCGGRVAVSGQPAAAAGSAASSQAGMTPVATSTGTRTAVTQASRSSSLSMLQARTGGMLAVSTGVGVDGASGPLKNRRPQMRDELSRARANAAAG